MNIDFAPCTKDGSYLRICTTSISSNRLSENPSEIRALTLLSNYLSSSVVSPLRKALTENEDPVASSIRMRIDLYRYTGTPFHCSV